MMMIERRPCPCCGAFVGVDAFYAALDAAVGHLGHLPVVSSGYRCARRNAQISARSTGRHVSGEAVDVIARSAREKGALLAACMRAGIVSFAVLPGGAGLHIDASPVPWLGIE